jgi:hypothetical protein
MTPPAPVDLAEMARELAAWGEQCAANLQTAAAKGAAILQGPHPCECLAFAQDLEIRVLRAFESAHLAGQRSQWQPIETAPRDTLILGVSVSGKYKVGIVFCAMKGWSAVIDERTGKWLECTHWQPLPPPPSLPAPEQSK